MINILEKLLGFPSGTILYSPVFGKCILMSVNEYTETITVTPLVYPTKQYAFSPFGQFMVGEICCGECLLFPSREQRNWENFTFEKEKDECKFKQFDKVVVRNEYDKWRIEFFERYNPTNNMYPYICLVDSYNKCLPYNEETAKLIGTSNTYEELINSNDETK